MDLSSVLLDISIRFHCVLDYNSQDTVDEDLPNSLWSYLSSVFQVLTVFIVIGSVTPLFLSFLLPLMFIFSWVQEYYISTSRELKRLESMSRSPIFSHFQETIAGAVTIRSVLHLFLCILCVMCDCSLND